MNDLSNRLTEASKKLRGVAQAGGILRKAGSPAADQQWLDEKPSELSASEATGKTFLVNVTTLVSEKYWGPPTMKHRLYVVDCPDSETAKEAVRLGFMKTNVSKVIIDSVEVSESYPANNIGLNLSEMIIDTEGNLLKSDAEMQLEKLMRISP